MVGNCHPFLLYVAICLPDQSVGSIGITGFRLHPIHDFPQGLGLSQKGSITANFQTKWYAAVFLYFLLMKSL